MAPLQSHELTIELCADDQPEDRFSNHVNNARYFAFINRTFQGWYVRMGIRGGVPGFSAAMAHMSYDFLREVLYPGTVRCSVRLVRIGTTSIEHAVEIWDEGAQPVLAGQGKAVHVWLDLASRRPAPWPQDLLAKCWSSASPVASLG